MSKPLKTFYDATKYLGQFIGQMDDMKFLKDTSCLAPDRRTQLAHIETLKEWILLEFPGDTQAQEFAKLLDTLIIPYLKRLGMAEWPRDTVTDMALRKGNPQDTEQWDTGQDDENQDETTTPV